MDVSSNPSKATAAARPPGVVVATHYLESQDTLAMVAGSDEARTKHNHGRNHQEIIWTGIAAVSASASPGVQNAGGSHPGERDDPDNHPRSWFEPQSQKDSPERKSPGQNTSASAAQPIP